MKITPLDCPKCGAKIEIDLKGMSNVFCPYCGTQFSVDDGNINININKNINIHRRNTDDAKVAKQRVELEKERNRHKESKRDDLSMLIMMLVCFGALLFMWLMEEGYLQLDNIGGERIAVVEVDSHGHYENREYHSVVAELEGLGFSDIETVDLNDAGWFKTEDYVSKISINGESSFSEKKYRVDSKIVIMYH